jgi:nitrogen permease regulator 2-like protein
MSLLSVFFAAFDNVVGPRIEYQVPGGFMSVESFDAVSDFLITRDLCGKVVTIVHPTLVGEPKAPRPAHVMGCPIGLSHERYPRNQLLCCVGFVLDEAVDTRPFDTILRKLAGYLLSMELERGFLFLPAEKAKLGGLLPEILHGLNTLGECFVRVGSGDTIALKLFPALPPPPDISDHDVPLPTRNLDMLAGNGEDSGLDFAMRLIIPHLDGIHCVSAIAERANMDPSVVRQCCRHLSYHGCIALVDLFQYSNVYASQPRVQLLLSNRALRDCCLSYIAAAPRQLEATGPATPVSAVPFDLVFRIYASFGAGMQIGDVSIRAGTAALGIDDHRLVVFGVMHGLLARVHKYPVRSLPLIPSHHRETADSDSSSVPVAAPGEGGLTGFRSVARQQAVPDVKILQGDQFPGSALASPTAQPAPLSIDGSSVRQLMSEELALLDGSRHLDELCCRLHCSQTVLETAIDAMGGYVYVLK